MSQNDEILLFTAARTLVKVFLASAIFLFLKLWWVWFIVLTFLLFTNCSAILPDRESFEEQKSKAVCINNHLFYDLRDGVVFKILKDPKTNEKVACEQ